MTNTHIEKLESVDTYLWRNVFNSISSTPTISYFIETNSIPIRFIVKGRRIMYYWNIIQRDESELVRKVFNSQTRFPVKNDWVVQLRQDLEECNIKLSDEEIKQMKKEQFKNLVLREIRRLAKEYLISQRKSKTENLMHTGNMKEYLTTQQMTTGEKQLLFAIKTKCVDVKTNFKNQFSKSNMFCRLCKNTDEEESELHLLKCNQIISDKQLQQQIKDISYSDVFGTLEQQVKAIKVWKKVFKVWKVKMEASNQSLSGHQAHLLQGQSASLPCTAAQNVDPSIRDYSNCNVYDFGL